MLCADVYSCGGQRRRKVEGRERDDGEDQTRSGAAARQVQGQQGERWSPEVPSPFRSRSPVIAGTSSC